MTEFVDNLVTYPALSIVAPHGENIAKGLKKLEIRKWKPEQLPLKNVMIIENKNYLLQENDQELGYAVALVDFVSVHAWQENEIEIAYASYWAAGYYAWKIENVRAIEPFPMIARRKIYDVELLAQQIIFKSFDF